MKHRCILLLLLTAILCSCDEDEKPLAEQIEWEEIKSVSYELSDAINLSDSVFFAGSNSLIKFKEETSKDSLVVAIDFLHNLHHLRAYDYAISDKYVAFINEDSDGIYVNSLENPSDRLWISLPEFDDRFRDFKVWQGRQRVGIAISDNTILIPYYESSSSVYFNILLVEINMDIEPEIKEFKIIEIDNIDSYTNFIRSTYSFGGNFYLNDAENCIMIAADGSHKVVCDSYFEHMFEYKGELYGIPFNAGVFKSSDGITWTKIMSSSINIHNNGYSQVGDNLISFDYEELSQVFFEGDSIFLKQIFSPDLEGYNINCVGTIEAKHVILGTNKGALKIDWDSFESLLE